MGVFDAINKFSAKSELRESKDEMLVGEIVRAMSSGGYVPDKFTAGTGAQIVRFRTPGDPVLSYLQVTLNRLTGSGRVASAVVGSQATMTLVGTVVNKISDPDDLIAMWQTDAANVLKVPMLGQIKLNHRVTTVTATSKLSLNIDNYVLQGPEATTQLLTLLSGKIDEVRQALAPYNKDDAGFEG